MQLQSLVTAIFAVQGVHSVLECFEYDTDYYGTNINNGFEQRTDNAEDCQKLCAFTQNCEGFTWASGSFFDPDYRNACWLKKDIIEKYAKAEAVSGPRECSTNPPDGKCCANLVFASTGNLADSEQNHVLGNYGYLSDGTGDRWNYRQNSGYNRKLWYNSWVNAWFIGDDLGSNVGYALAYGDSTCPEDLPATWEYWGFNTGQWIKDEHAKFTCQDTTPAPQPDQCVTGDACKDCGLTVENNGITYCCNNYCDFGWLNVDGVCTCGHD